MKKHFMYFEDCKGGMQDHVGAKNSIDNLRKLKLVKKSGC